ncbi:hypothetical protein Hanom_Chr03g00253351 [Helianthus anomalus]
MCMVNTCIFPIKWANSTSPMMAMSMANDVSPINVLVAKFCPYELHVVENKSEFQGLSFIFKPIFRRCPLCSKLTSFVLYVFVSYTFCPLGLTQLVFSVKFGHMLCT